MKEKFRLLIYIMFISLMSFSMVACTPNMQDKDLHNSEDVDLDVPDKSNSGETELVVYASFFPIYDLCREVIGKENIDLHCFMPADQDPHLWEPTPRDLQALTDADLLVVNGANVEERWLGSVRENLPELEILTLSNSVDLITYTGAAALGDFQYLARLELKAGELYPIEFGHTHQDLMRIAFFQSDSEKDDEIIAEAKKVMEAKGEVVPQQANIQVENKKVYGIEMGHTSGLIHYSVPQDGVYYFVSDRLSEPILSYILQTPSKDELNQEVILAGSSSALDKVTYDPHSWMSTVNAKSYLNSINMKLAELCPHLRNSLNKNKVKAVTTLTNMEYEYRKKFEECERTNFVVTHYAYEYLARDFGLIQWPLQGLTSMQDPSLKTIKRAIYYCQANKIDTIFYESNGNSKGAEAIALEIDGKVATLNSMEFVASNNNSSYLEIMRENLENLYQSMR